MLCAKAEIFEPPKPKICPCGTCVLRNVESYQTLYERELREYERQKRLEALGNNENNGYNTEYNQKNTPLYLFVVSDDEDEQEVYENHYHYNEYAPPYGMQATHQAPTYGMQVAHQAATQFDTQQHFEQHHAHHAHFDMQPHFDKEHHHHTQSPHKNYICNCDPHNSGVPCQCSEAINQNQKQQQQQQQQQPKGTSKTKIKTSKSCTECSKCRGKLGGDPACKCRPQKNKRCKTTTSKTTISKTEISIPASIPSATSQTNKTDSNATLGGGLCERCKTALPGRRCPLLIKRPVCKVPTGTSESQRKSKYTCDAFDSDDDNDSYDNMDDQCKAWCSIQNIERTLEGITPNQDCLCYCVEMGRKPPKKVKPKKKPPKKKKKKPKPTQKDDWLKAKYNRFNQMPITLYPRPLWLDSPPCRHREWANYHPFGRDPVSCYQRDYTPCW